jgi:hypothetical protein
MKKVLLFFVIMCIVNTISAQKRKIRIKDLEITFGYEDKIKKGEVFSPYWYKNTFIGLGFALPINTNQYLPTYYGNSFNLEIGKQYLYRAGRFYSIGTMFKWNCYSYKVKTEGKDTFGLDVATTEGRHFYRTDNLGTGIINRFHFSRYVYLELTAWGDYSYSKRLKIKYRGDDGKKKWKYRDGSKFNPFAAGLQGGVGYKNTLIYLRYRVTNCFNPNLEIPEVSKYSIGVRVPIGVRIRFN